MRFATGAWAARRTLAGRYGLGAREAGIIAALVLAGPGAASGTPLPQAICAAYDVHVLTLQEDAAAAEVDGEAILESAAALGEARRLCRTGATGRALDLYRAAEERLPRIQAWLR